MLALMRQPRTAADEPAGTFSIQSVTRALIMSDTKLFELSIAEAGRKLRDGSITSTALTGTRCRALRRSIRARQLHHRDRRSARADAVAADVAFGKGSTTGRCRACLTR